MADHYLILHSRSKVGADMSHVGTETLSKRAYHGLSGWDMWALLLNDNYSLNSMFTCCTYYSSCVGADGIWASSSSTLPWSATPSTMTCIIYPSVILQDWLRIRVGQSWPILSLLKASRTLGSHSIAPSALWEMFNQLRSLGCSSKKGISSLSRLLYLTEAKNSWWMK